MLGLSGKILYTVAILTVILCLCSEEVDGRRVILKGRKTLTRTYYYDSFLPGWISVLLFGLVEIIFGAILYLILKKIIIDPPMTGFYNAEHESAALRS
ncbi:hypothetical protein HHI36_018179 [Cryptolaemus montrouzieri]|uniref:Uncharacterized protein n=1 Tax=Cryptolaemus montrouzieri TaxID=559131 RepID=A0ABD2NZF7_9CUCU